jgi:hypothetical protein
VSLERLRKGAPEPHRDHLGTGLYGFRAERTRIGYEARQAEAAFRLRRRGVPDQRLEGVEGCSHGELRIKQGMHQEAVPDCGHEGCQALGGEVPSERRP